MKNVIYFPYISVPENQWFTSTLLYYDKIYSIVPSAFQSYNVMAKPYTKKLIDAHLLDSLSPTACINNIPQFSNNFLEIIEDSRNTPKINEKNFKMGEKIHFEKLFEIGDKLVEKELAFLPHNDPSWYYVEPTTAHIFMTYLAKTLGELPAVNATPITDSFSNNGLLASNNITQAEKKQIENMIRLVLLREILPVPINDIDVADLRSFKSDNQDELVKFRSHIEKEIDRFSLIGDITNRNNEIKSFLDNENEQITSIVKKMKDNKWKVMLGNVARFTPSALMFINSIRNQDFVGSTAAAGELLSKAASLRKNKQLPPDIAYAVILRDSLRI